MMPEWLQELEQEYGVCEAAKTDIRWKDPSLWWAYSSRGDWMLYYMSCLALEGGGDDTDSLVDDIAAYVRCPAVSWSLEHRPTILARLPDPVLSEYYIWGSGVDVDPALLASLAIRIRLLWPDLPLVM